MKPILRITGGASRGRRILSPSGRGVRPCPARVRIAIFNMLEKRQEGAHVLDLFAGTGSLGLESLSRGAESCLFVERGAAPLRALQKNIETLGCGGAAQVYGGDAFGCLPALRILDAPSDIVFFDPPHRYWQTKGTALIELLRSLADSDAVVKAAVWVIGHPRGAPDPDALSFLGRPDHRAYGAAHITIAR